MASNERSNPIVEKEGIIAFPSDYDHYFEIPQAGIGTFTWQEAYDALLPQIREDFSESTLNESEINCILESFCITQQIISEARMADYKEDDHGD